MTYFKKFFSLLTSYNITYYIHWLITMLFLYTVSIFIYLGLIHFLVPFFNLSSYSSIVLLLKSIFLMIVHILMYYISKKINLKSEFFINFFSKKGIIIRCLFIFITSTCLILYISNNLSFNIPQYIFIVYFIPQILVYLSIHLFMLEKPNLYTMLFFLAALVLFVIANYSSIDIIIHSYIMSTIILYMNPVSNTGSINTQNNSREFNNRELSNNFANSNRNIRRSSPINIISAPSPIVRERYMQINERLKAYNNISNDHSLSLVVNHLPTNIPRVKELDCVLASKVIPVTEQTMNANFYGLQLDWKEVQPRHFLSEYQLGSGICVRLPVGLFIDRCVYFPYTQANNEYLVRIISMENFTRYVITSKDYSSAFSLVKHNFGFGLPYKNGNSTFIPVLLDDKTITRKKNIYFFSLAKNKGFANALNKYHITNGLIKSDNKIPKDWETVYNRLETYEKIGVHVGSRLLIQNEGYLSGNNIDPSRFFTNQNLYPLPHCRLINAPIMGAWYPYINEKELNFYHDLHREGINWANSSDLDKLKWAKELRTLWTNGNDVHDYKDIHFIAAKVILSSMSDKPEFFKYLLPAGLVNNTPPNPVTAAITPLPAITTAWLIHLNHYISIKEIAIGN